MSESQAPTLRYQSLDPNNARDVVELRRQRMLCGWAEDYVGQWMNMMRAGERVMYWLFLDNDPNPPTEDEPFGAAVVGDDRSSLPPFNPDFRPVGHIAFDWVDYRGDASLACKETGTIMISTFFILSSKQGSKLGKKVMDHMEKIAQDELGCRTITLNTPPAESIRGDAMRARRGQAPLKDPAGTFVPQEWYARRGYQTYKEEMRYSWKAKDGEMFLAPAVFMRKDVSKK